MRINCAYCGKFIRYKEITSALTGFYYEPDSIYGPECIEYKCAKCTAMDDNKE